MTSLEGMTDWQLQIPYRSRSDSLADVVEAARELDLIEITGTVAPMNADTRVLATKAIDEHDLVRAKARRDMFER